MNEDINKIQSDIHLYEDYINSIQYLEEFDWKLIKRQVRSDRTVSAPIFSDRNTSLEAFISTSKKNVIVITLAV